MKRTFFAIATLGLFSTLGHAAVTLNVDEHIKVTAINGQAISQSPFKPLQRTFTLEAGQHVITARYDRLYHLNNHDHDYLRSGDVTVSAAMQDNQSYRLAMLDAPEQYRDAKEYAKAPTLAVIAGNDVIAKNTSTAKQSGLLSGFGNLFGRGNSDAILDNQRTISAIQQPSAPVSHSAVVVSSPTHTAVAVRTNTLDNFMQLWLNASEEERAKIRQWIQE